MRYNSRFDIGVLISIKDKQSASHEVMSALVKGSMTETSLRKIAAFDFDGTSIRGNSPVLLVHSLFHDKMLSKYVVAKIASWGIAYKFHLPQNEAWVRGLVFTAFEGLPQEEADMYLRRFYDEVIEGEKRFRQQAATAMRELRDQGVEVLVVSATFEPIVQRAKELHPFDNFIATKMATNTQGCYTTSVDGPCIEGEEKVKSIRAYADARYGCGKWELVAAYGDHHSDAPLLAAAKQGFAVCPDKTLERKARRHNWTILDWSEDVKN